MTVNIFEKTRPVFKVIINQGAAHLHMVSVIKVIIKPPPNQGDDGWHLKKWSVFLEKTVGFQQNRSVTIFFSEIWTLNFLSKIENQKKSFDKPEKSFNFQQNLPIFNFLKPNYIFWISNNFIGFR
jgi:hypothetical protein